MPNFSRNWKRAPPNGVVARTAGGAESNGDWIAGATKGERVTGPPSLTGVRPQPRPRLFIGPFFPANPSFPQTPGPNRAAHCLRPATRKTIHPSGPYAGPCAVPRTLSSPRSGPKRCPRGFQALEYRAKECQSQAASAAPSAPHCALLLLRLSPRPRLDYLSARHGEPPKTSAGCAARDWTPACRKRRRSQ